MTSRIPEKATVDGLEDRWAGVWEREGTFRFDENATREQVYSIDTPPPTVSGSLHVGHVFSYTHTDVVARYQRMCGREVFYPMGWDDNGLPTERRVQNYFGVRCDPSLPYDASFAPPFEGGEGKSGDQIPISRRNFVELCERLTADDERQFESLWRHLGLSVDWSRTYQTVSPSSQAVAQQAFLRSLARGEAYQAEAPTLWDITFRTAVAQAELEDRERPGAYHRVGFVPVWRRRADLHRDHEARAAARVRCARCAPGRPALSGPVRHHRCHSPVRRRGADPCPPLGVARQGLRHRDDLHLRRHHRRHVVARAAASHACRTGPRRPVPCRGPRRHSVGRRPCSVCRTGW